MIKPTINSFYDLVRERTRLDTYCKMIANPLPDGTVLLETQAHQVFVEVNVSALDISWPLTGDLETIFFIQTFCDMVFREY